ncbi:hypothetical protein HWV62_4840 [Athelia sp. TMB]|nr:hypothetical protein HWV62_4840 [Athelia sp. TMB]
MHHALVTYGFLSAFIQLLHSLWAVVFGLVIRLVLYICSVLFDGKRQPPILPTCSPFSTPPAESPSAFECGGGFKGTSISHPSLAYSPPLPYDDIPDSLPLQPVKPVQPVPSKRRSRRPKKLRLSLSAISEGPDEDDVELPRSVSHPALGSPTIYAGMLNTRHVSLRTTSTRSCYSLSSLEGSLSDILFTGALVAADTCLSFNAEDDSLAGLIASDVFLPAVRPPSLNTPPVSQLCIKPHNEPTHPAIVEFQVSGQDTRRTDTPGAPTLAARRGFKGAPTLAARRGFKGAPLSLPLPEPQAKSPEHAHKMGSYWSPDTTVFASPRSAGAAFLAGVRQMTGLLSPKSFGSPLSTPQPPSPAYLCESYADCDPFADYGGSYYAPGTPGKLEEAREDILDISFYQTESGTARTGLGIALGSSTTSIYNLSIADVCDGGRTSTPARRTAPKTPERPASAWFAEGSITFGASPRIALTPPSPTRSAPEEDSPRARAALLHNPALRPFLLPLHVAHRERRRDRAADVPARPPTARGHLRCGSHALVPLASPEESEVAYYTAPSSPDDGPESAQAVHLALETRDEQDIASVSGQGCPPVTATASEKRRSRAVVDLISLLDAAAAGAADALDAISCEGQGREEVDIGEVALVHAF